MGLFTDIYNTVAKFFRPQEESDGEASKSVATNRLKLVLMQDRTNLTPKILEQMRSELIDLLSRYVELDKELLELNFEQEGDQVALMLSIPVIRAKDEDEIEAAIKAHNESHSEEYDEEDIEENTQEESDENTEDNDVNEIEDEVALEEGEADVKPKKRKKKSVDSTVSTPDEINSNISAEEENNAENIEQAEEV